MKKKIRLVCALIIPMFVFIILEMFFYVYNIGYYIPFSNAKAQILSYVFIYGIFFMMFGLTKSSFKSTVIISIFTSFILFINQIKIFYTAEPLMISDIFFVTSVGELGDIVDGTLGMIINTYGIPSIIYVISIIIVCFAAKKCKIKIENKIERNISILLPLITLIILFFPFDFLRNIMLKNIFEINTRSNSLLNLEYYIEYGILPGMYGLYLENIYTEPENYNEIDVNRILDDTKYENEEKKFGQPNIIVLFGESFWDIDQVEEIKFDKTVTSNLKELKEKGLFFNMISPSYGGSSANVEFEFLTSANLMYFNRGYIPYLQLYKDKTYYNRPTIIQELKNNNYKTKIVSYTSKYLFNNGKVYDYMGVDETEFINEIDEKYIKGKYVSDEHVVDKIIQDFENKDDKKIFYMALTMQAHMPYLKDKYKEYDLNIVNSKLPDEMNETLLSYAQGIYDTDKQLGRLNEYIQTLDEPTLIVFYGDHLPHLETVNGEEISKYLKYFNTGDDLLNNYRKYNTQAIILANFEIKDEQTKYLSPDLLGSYLVNNMDIKVSNYFKWIYTNKESLCSANYLISMDKEGNLYYTDKLPSELKNTYNIRKNVQYKYFIK